jgi:hypothetical protein
MAGKATLNLRVDGSIPSRLTTFNEFMRRFSISAMRGANLSRSKSPTDPVLSLFCAMQRSCRCRRIAFPHLARVPGAMIASMGR